MAVLTHLETDTGTNVDISGATAVGAYTANGDKLIMVDVSIDAVAGNGDYVMYVTRQIGGSGSAYRILPQTTMTAASGLTAISGQSGWITVRNGDVLTCYVDGLAGDTTTPDWSTRWYELAGVTAAAVADAVWDEAIADHTTATTFGGKNQKVVPSETINDYKADVSGLALDGEYDADFTQVVELLYSIMGGEGWTDETLVSIQSAIEALDTNSVLLEAIDGTYTLKEVIYIMVSLLGGKLTRVGNTLTFRDLSDTTDVVVAETDEHKQRIAMTYTV